MEKEIGEWGRTMGYVFRVGGGRLKLDSHAFS